MGDIMAITQFSLSPNTLAIKNKYCKYYNEQ